MNKIFKPSLIAMAVSSVAFTAFPTIAEETDAKYDVYGIIVVQAHYRDYENSPSLTGFQTNNESRIGFRGSKQFQNLGPKFIWQIEGVMSILLILITHQTVVLVKGIPLSDSKILSRLVKFELVVY